MITSSPLWTSSELREATHGHLMAETDCFNVSIDTRQIKKGDLFIALIGHHSDGHRYILQALEQGASVVMAHNIEILSELGLSHDPRILLVENTLKGLVALGRYARARFNGKVIAVTGSVGKTTTKEILRHILAPHGQVHASVASFNNHWGVPLTLARLPREATFCVSEIGMNHAREIAPLVTQVQPHCAIITTIGSAHIGHMGSKTAIAQEKSTLFSGLISAHSFAIIPDDTGFEDIIRAALPASTTLLRAGFSESAELRIKDLTLSASGSLFSLETPQKTINITLSVPGEHFVRNTALALGVLTGLGLDPVMSLDSLKAFTPEAGRGQIRSLGDDITLVDESYNASSDSIKAALATLALRPAQRRIVALGDMLELGHYATKEHVDLADFIKRCHALTFCCGTYMKALFDALPPELQGGYAPDAAGLIPLLKNILCKGDVLLVKGSLGSRMKDLINGLETVSLIKERQS